MGKKTKIKRKKREKERKRKENKEENKERKQNKTKKRRKEREKRKKTKKQKKNTNENGIESQFLSNDVKFSQKSDQNVVHVGHVVGGLLRSFSPSQSLISQKKERKEKERGGISKAGKDYLAGKERKKKERGEIQSLFSANEKILFRFLFFFSFVFFFFSFCFCFFLVVVVSFVVVFCFVFVLFRLILFCCVGGVCIIFSLSFFLFWGF